MLRYITLPALVVTLATTFTPVQVLAQTVPDLLVAPQASATPRTNRPVRRLRTARVNLAALDSATVRLQLFDDTWLTVRRTREDRPASDKRVWVGARRVWRTGRAVRCSRGVDRHGVRRQPHLRGHHRPGRSIHRRRTRPGRVPDRRPDRRRWALEVLDAAGGPGGDADGLVQPPSTLPSGLRCRSTR